MGLVATKGIRMENVQPDSVFALEPDARPQRALMDLRGALNDELAAAPGLQQRVWATIVAEIEADEAAGYDRLARMAG